MIIYVEKRVRNLEETRSIIDMFSGGDVIEIDNYKNLFDKKTGGKILEKVMIIAAVNTALLEAPALYGYAGRGFFLKNSMNCVFDCKYCYLKGAFPSDIPIFFVNYYDIQEQILRKVDSLRKNGYEGDIWLYSSDYSDNLATNGMTRFLEYFIPCIEKLENVYMEVRTKSSNIQDLLQFDIPKNTEIAFSLNPQEIINQYESKTSSLDDRLEAVNALLQKGWKVGLRFLPLLEVPDYKTLYTDFIAYVLDRIDMQKVFSIFIGGLMYTAKDYQTLLKRQPYLDILYTLQKGNDGFYRESPEVRAWFYDMFSKRLLQKQCYVCLDSESENIIASVQR